MDEGMAWGDSSCMALGSPRVQGEEQPQEAAVTSQVMHQKTLWRPGLGRTHSTI